MNQLSNHIKYIKTQKLYDAGSYCLGYGAPLIDKSYLYSNWNNERKSNERNKHNLCINVQVLIESHETEWELDVRT